MGDKEKNVVVTGSSKTVVQEAHSQRLTSLLLNGRSFLPWSRAVTIALGGRSWLGHITGRTKIPQESDPSFDGEPKQPNLDRFSNCDPSKKCDYHIGEVGHSTDDCYVLKHKVLDLLDTGAFTFRASWLCQGRDDLFIVPNIQTIPPSPARMIHEEKEVIDTLRQLSDKFDYYVKYSAPPSFYIDPRDIVPDGWRGMDNLTPLVTEDPDDVMKGITALFNNMHIGAIEEGPFNEMGTGSRE